MDPGYITWSINRQVYLNEYVFKSDRTCQTVTILSV